MLKIVFKRNLFHGNAEDYILNLKFELKTNNVPSHYA